MPATFITKMRLQVQPPGRPGIDRSVSYWRGEPDESQRWKFRKGLHFIVANRVAAATHFGEMHAAAKEAVARNEVGKFLDALDKREDTSRDDLGPTFDEFSIRWESEILLANGHPESELDSTRSILRKHLRTFFGRYRLREIPSEMVDRYKAKKATEEHQFGKGYSASAVNSQLSVLNRVLKKAVEYGLLDATPIRATAWRRRERTPEDHQNYWTPEEEAKAFAVLAAWLAAGAAMALPMMTQLITGIRVGELRVLQPRDLDFNAPGIWIRRSMARKTVRTPKNGHARFVPIPRDLAEKLRAHAEGREPDALLFPAKEGGPLRNNVVNRGWTKLAAEAGVHRISSHGARHTTGSTLADLGAGQKLIGTALGHRDSKATERYVHAKASQVGVLTDARWERLTKGATPPATPPAT